MGGKYKKKLVKKEWVQERDWKEKERIRERGCVCKWRVESGSERGRVCVWSNMTTEQCAKQRRVDSSTSKRACNFFFVLVFWGMSMREKERLGENVLSLTGHKE